MDHSASAHLVLAMSPTNGRHRMEPRMLPTARPLANNAIRATTGGQIACTSPDDAHHEPGDAAGTGEHRGEDQRACAAADLAEVVAEHAAAGSLLAVLEHALLRADRGFCGGAGRGLRGG